MRYLLMLVAAAACAPKPMGETPAATGKCDAAAVQGLVGQPVAAVRADAQRRSGAATVRVYRTGDAVTMDFREDRLNIETAPDGRIVALRCG